MVFVVEQEGLDRGDDDLRPPPVVPVLFVDDRLEIGRQHRRKRFLGLVFQFQAVHQKQNAPRVAGTQKQLDDGSCRKRFASAGSHLEQKTVLAVLHGLLHRVDGPQLVRSQESQLVVPDEAGTLLRVLPCRFGLVVRALGENNVVFPDLFVNKALRIWLHLLVTGNGSRCWKRSDDVRVAPFQIPKIVKVPVGKDNKTAVLRFGVFPGLLFADKRVLVFRLGFQHKQRKASGIEQQKINEPFASLLEVLSHRIEFS